MTESGTEFQPVYRSAFSKDMEATGKVPPLRTVKEAAEKMMVPEERLLQLAQDGFAPCVKIADGPPLFYMKDLAPWVMANLIEEGLPKPMPVLCVNASGSVDHAYMPEALSSMPDLRMYGQATIPCCVYFLCYCRRVQYVGQTVNLPARMGEHKKSKDGKFDSVFYVPVPAERLNEVELAFIRVLKPPLNKNGSKDWHMDDDEIIVRQFSKETYGQSNST